MTGKSFNEIGLSIKRHNAMVQFSVKKIAIEKDIYSDTKKHIEDIVNSFCKIDFIVTNVDLLALCNEKYILGNFIKPIILNQ